MVDMPSSPVPTTPSEDAKLLAALSYLLFLSILILLWRRDDPFIRAHAKQGVVLLLAFIAFWAVPVLNGIVEAVVLLGILWGFFRAINGRTWRMPLLGGFAEKIPL